MLRSVLTHDALDFPVGLNLGDYPHIYPYHRELHQQFILADVSGAAVVRSRLTAGHIVMTTFARGYSYSRKSMAGVPRDLNPHVSEAGVAHYPPVAASRVKSPHPGHPTCSDEREGSWCWPKA